MFFEFLVKTLKFNNRKHRYYIQQPFVSSECYLYTYQRDEESLFYSRVLMTDTSDMGVLANLMLRSPLIEIRLNIYRTDREDDYLRATPL